MEINIQYDFSQDVRGNADIDTYSKTLHEYHHILWNKPLPNGKGRFDIEKSASKNGPYKFTYKGKIYTSDAIHHTFKNFKRKSVQALIRSIEKEDPSITEDFHALGNTIGGYVLFPGEKENHTNTINQARGFNSTLNDRFDLALECIRLSYQGNHHHPLEKTLKAYQDFFDLFGSFKGYIDFFLLQDLVTPDYKKIKFWHPFESFETSPSLPANKAEYMAYREKVMNFVNLRNKRIKAYSQSSAK
jgi:hypothetical protein